MNLLSSRKPKSREKIRTELCPWQWDAITSTVIHFALISGIATGKTTSGAHFVITQCCANPTLTGLIAANSYDQLSQATLRELFYWLERYSIEYVIDRIPPEHWGADRMFKSYNNILSVRIGEHVAHVFTRVLSDPDALRGIECSWYWIDESRDTTLAAHDVILSRLRESETIKGLVTTTPNAEDWVWKRFVAEADGINFASIHVPTSESVKFGLISEEFYAMLRSAYSPAMAAQELDAEHVCVFEGRAYYCVCAANVISSYAINDDYPLFVGCDFNYAPAPMVWVIGQDIGDGIVIFDELSGVEVSTVEMTRRLAAKYGDYFLKIFGDASGTRGTTSNAGYTDFAQIAETLSDEGVRFTVDTDQANPRVSARVENVNRLLRNADNHSEIRYVPSRCPFLHADFERVSWRGPKVYDNGDCQRTHASDALGYAMWKLRPPLAGRAGIGYSVRSPFAGDR